MTRTPISVVIPVGPSEANKRWLAECLDSVRAQTHQAAQILLIDDQAGLTPYDVVGHADIWRTPWLSGVAHSFNFGVALASEWLVVLLGSDDLLAPHALADLAATWDHVKDPLGYYGMKVKYIDNREEQDIPCGGAMVTKDLWRHTGGFPVQAAVGASDTMLLSIMMGNSPAAGNIYRVPVINGDGPHYLYRRHPDTDTAVNYSRFESEITTIRDRLTRDWRPARATVGVGQ